MNQSGHILEMEYSPDYDSVVGMMNGPHFWYRITVPSRKPPSYLTICSEGCEEGKKYIDLRCFDQEMQGLPTGIARKVYYNPRADIIFFGDRTCTPMMAKFCMSNRGKPIPQVAMICCRGAEECRDLAHDAYDVEAGCNTMQALHGFNPDVTIHDNLYGGCPGLQEVYPIVKSKLYPLDRGIVDATVGLRAATNSGLSEGHAQFMKDMKYTIEQLQDGHSVYGTGDNVWQGANMPTFHFASFAPLKRGIEDRVFDGMEVSSRTVYKLSKYDWGFLKNIEQGSGCKIEVVPEEYRGEDPREIGLVGTAEGVEMVKRKILAKLDSAGGGHMEWEDYGIRRCYPRPYFILNARKSPHT